MVHGARLEMAHAVRLIGHELRGALTPVRVWARLLSDGRAAGGDVRQIGEMLTRTVQVLDRLAADLSDLRTPNVGTLGMSFAALDLRDVVAPVAAGMTAEAGARGVALSCRLPHDPVPVVADEVRLAQVIANLLDNALKFTGRGGSVAVEVARSTDSAAITIEDTGVGMTKEFLPHAFERHAREPAQARSRPGKGLGLYLVKRLIERHGGTIEAKSDGPARGCRMQVRLPLAPLAGVGEAV